jgi:hypothetical protein
MGPRASKQTRQTSERAVSYIQFCKSRVDSLHNGKDVSVGTTLNIELCCK